MPIIGVIAKREVQRLRGRFRGGSRSLVLALLGLTILLAALAFRNGPNLGQGLYRIGVLPGGPQLIDRRFIVSDVDRATGRALLDAGQLDALVDGATVSARDDQKSQYALGALKRTLEQQELARINDQYPLADAFPLRIEVNYLTTTQDSAAALAGSLADLLPAAPAPLDSAAPAPAPGAALPAASDAAVREQLQAAAPQIKLDPAANKEIIVPSLMTPPLPFAQVLIAFIYIMPVSFVSVFFVSSFMDEKVNRRLTLLLSAPVTPLQIILGKMLPYVTFSIAATTVIALVSRAEVLTALAIFIPVILFVFAIYLMVPMLYRTYKDTTFISMLATALTTTYLIFPAAFSGVSDLAYISPLTLVVKLYRAEAFGLREYLFSVVPLLALFGLSVYAATRVLNEEYLMGYRPLSRKVADAIFLLLNRRHLFLSILLLSVLLIPLVYLGQLALLAMSTNLPISFAIGVMFVVAAIIEEVAKSIGIVALIERGYVRSVKRLLALALLSAIGFLIGEKLILLVSLSVVSESAFAAALFNTGALIVPLIAHFVFTAVVCVLRGRLRVRYPIAVLIGAALHAGYNWLIAGGLT